MGRLWEKMGMTKKCRECGVEKPAEAFMKHNMSPDGRTKICKSCRYPNVKEVPMLQKKRNFPPFKGYGFPGSRERVCP